MPTGPLPAPLLVVAIALCDPAGRVLLQRRPAGREHAGLWEFPGGKLEPGEGPLQALIRECREELAITLAAGDCQPLSFASSDALAGHDDGRVVILLLYGARAWQGTPVSQEGATLAWAGSADAAQMPMPPLDVPLLPLAFAFANSRPLENGLPRGASTSKCASPKRP